MIHSAADLAALEAIASQAASAAAAMIKEKWGREINVSHKQGGDTIASQVLTEVDLAAQEMILDLLQPSIHQYDLGLLAEESEDDNSRREKGSFWCIDPLDGTLPFIEGTAGFAVSIALVSRAGAPLIGAVCNPLNGSVVSAGMNLGVRKDGAAWQRERASVDQDMSFYCDRSLLKHDRYNALLDRLNGFARGQGLGEVRITAHGGAVMNACWTMANEPACYVKFPKKEQGGGSIWDYAATACIATEARAHVSDVFGVPLALNQRDSCFMNRGGVLYASSHQLGTAILPILRDFT